MKHLFLVLTTLLLLALLAACGSSDTGNVPEGDAAVTAAPEEETTADEAAVADDDCDEGLRLFDHALLSTDPVCVPENPQRIAAMDRSSYETLLALGIEPIAGTDFALNIDDDLPYLTPLVENVINVGSPIEINLEVVLQAEPDLILTLDIYEATEALSEIAPTVSFTFDSSDQWRENAVAVAEAVNQTEALETVVMAYEQRLTDLNGILDVPDDFTVSIIRTDIDDISLPVQDLFLHTILNDAGLSVPVAWDELEVDGAYASISLERIDLAEADVMLIWWGTPIPEDDEEVEQFMAEVEEHPLWQTLDVVQNEGVYFVGSYWIGSSYHAAHAVIDDLFTHIAKMDPQEVSPNPFTVE